VLKGENMDTLQQVIAALKELGNDSSTSKSVKVKVASMLVMLNDEAEVSMKVSKALHELEEISEDINVQSDTRTQIFNIVSLLEVV